MEMLLPEKAKLKQIKESVKYMDYLASHGLGFLGPYTDDVINIIQGKSESQEINMKSKTMVNPEKIVRVFAYILEHKNQQYQNRGISTDPDAKAMGEKFKHLSTDPSKFVEFYKPVMSNKKIPLIKPEQRQLDLTAFRDIYDELFSAGSKGWELLHKKART